MLEPGFYCMDCMDAMKEFPDKFFDLCLTDPPYGIGVDYGCFDDSEENLKAFISEFMPEILRVSKRALITCGTKNIHYYPKPDWILSWVSTAGTGCCKWGFTCWQPILAYGEDPFLSSKLGSRPDVILSNEPHDKAIDFHPCPKPIKLWTSILQRGSINADDKILDPFTGSGTTAIVCHRTGREFFGFEIDPDYFKAATARIEKEKSQLTIFESAERAEQEKLF